MPNVIETKSRSSVFPDYETLGDHEGISGRTGFGRNEQIHDDLIAYFLKLKSEGRVPKDGFRVFFPATSVGCEPYYFAMLVREAGLEELITIHASDLKEEFLKYAWEAKYSHRALKELPERFTHYFTAIDDEKTFQLSPEITRMVAFTPHGDLREKKVDQQYDAVVMPHVVYHYLYDNEKRDLLKKAFDLSRGIVAVEDTSYDENPHLFEEVMLRARFGMVNYDTFQAVELKQVRERTLTERWTPWTIWGLWAKPKPVTDIHRSPDKHYFAALAL